MSNVRKNEVRNPEVNALGAALSAALIDLHRALIHAEAGDDPALRNPYTLLFSVLGDKRFAWTSGLAQTIVRLDEGLDEGEIETIDDLRPFRAQAARLLDEEEGEDPKTRVLFVHALRRAPDVAIATGKLRAVLRRFPQPVAA